jgi:hypothetical protein
MAIDKYRADFSLDEMDKTEGKEIEDLIARSQKPLPDPDEWLEIRESLKGNVLVESATNIIAVPWRWCPLQPRGLTRAVLGWRSSVPLHVRPTCLLWQGH